MFNFYEVMGWVALSLNVWGNLALAKKDTFGWVIRLLCNIAFIIYSFYFKIYPLLVNHIIFAFVNIYGWYKWNTETRKCKCGRTHTKERDNTNCVCELPIRFTK